MPKQDKYYNTGIGLSDPSNEAYAVVEHASDPISTFEDKGAPKYLYVGTAGDLVVKLPDSDDDVTYKNVAVGFVPIRPSHIRSATTAGDIIAHY